MNIQKMMRYSIEPKNWIFVKGSGFLSFAKNMSKAIGKNKSKNLSCKCGHKFLDHTKQSATEHLKLFQEKKCKNNRSNS